MRIHGLTVILLSLLLIGCEPVAPCDPPTEVLEIDEVIYEPDVEEIIRTLQIISRDHISCKTACEFMHNRRGEYRFESAESCSFQLASETASDPESEVGYVRCTSTGVEYGCG